MAAEVDSLGYHTRYHTKKKPPKSFKLLKTEYAPATEMLANPDKYGGILAVLELLAKQTEVGG